MNGRATITPLLVVFFSSLLPAADWRPIDPSELAQKSPKVEPTADAEAIFWDVKIEDKLTGSDLQLVMNHYIRIKIFTDRGKEKYAVVELEQSGKRRIGDVAGRTIKPDGTIIELKKDSIFDRDLAKTKGLKVRGKSFTLPNVEVGDIIEYRYREFRDDEVASHMRLYFQRELPMWNVTYHVKPLEIPWLPYGMRSLPLNCEVPRFKPEPNGFYGLTLANMPAFRNERYAPPEDQLRAWMLIYYEEDKKIDPEKYWKSVGRDDYKRFKPRMKVDGAVKTTAAELVAGIEKPEEKLAAIETFCRTKIRNLASSTVHLTAAERKEIKVNNSPGDTLEQKLGYGLDINLLFAALATSAGFDARITRLADRGDTFFNINTPLTYFLNSFSVAVKVDEQWRFFDPSTPYLDHGMLRWQEELGQALISDPKGGFFTPTPYSEPARSLRERRGEFKLLPDGSLEGSVRLTYSGHAGRDRKLFYEDMTAAQQEEDWKDDLKNRLSTAEMTNFHMADVTEPYKPLVVTHNVTVPAYATRTGKRILLQPAFFQRNLTSRLTETSRKWDVYFDYGWAEDDEITIELPEGWVLDQPAVPVNSKIADAGNYSTQVLKTNDGRKLIYRRKFEWGYNKRILFPVAAYSNIKQIFDFVQEQDGYTIALKAAADGK
ncbi:DUF3857 domain-containing protein [uncultured Paludibaculum sp.]|uniref:DUF3857 domain-containing protein n=1 Tax=uncultured Paludibaculum sp. TaxID=1765020 RepID=UPI002AABEB3F|nr:DUF3857 domain-containing protein [uncultured Paludibaculum sp.]